MGYDPKGMITRPHFLNWKPACQNAPPPLHVMSMYDEGNWYPLPRPLEAGGVAPGPGLVCADPVGESLGIDPTDPSSWEGRGYRQCAGMIGRFNGPDDWLGLGHPGGQGVRPS